MFDTKICKCVWKLWKPDRCVYLSQKGEHGVFFREWYEWFPDAFFMAERVKKEKELSPLCSEELWGEMGYSLWLLQIPVEVPAVH